MFPAKHINVNLQNLLANNTLCFKLFAKLHRGNDLWLEFDLIFLGLCVQLIVRRDTRHWAQIKKTFQFKLALTALNTTHFERHIATFVALAILVEADWWRFINLLLV